MGRSSRPAGASAIIERRMTTIPDEPAPRFQSPRRRPKIRPSTDAVQATSSQAKLAADARHEG